MAVSSGRACPLWLHPDSELQFLPSDALAETILWFVGRGMMKETFNVVGRGGSGKRPTR